ncbi:tRNA adenosine(34) deaminase TadA [Eubacteriales bacterium OttesenSCG-928-N13]|nr:tRNA adenosine(34) deaminase TadA [Eubacteriales bacterium OttesenSCG-928-N13]
MKTIDEQMMRAALDEARLAQSEGELPIGAIITRDHEIIARGHNLREQTKDPSAHAEIVAIRRAAQIVGDWRLNDLTMYVTLEPCPMCAGAIVMARLHRVVFGAYDEQAGCAGSRYRITEDPSFNHFAPATGGVLQDECAQLLAAFFRLDRRGN